jgi:hypothetical protein
MKDGVNLTPKEKGPAMEAKVGHLIEREIPHWIKI